MKYLRLLAISAVFASFFATAQDEGILSGNFQSNFSVFLRDTAIGADETASPQYGKQISSAEAWLFLNYDVKDFVLDISKLESVSRIKPINMNRGIEMTWNWIQEQNNLM